MNSEVQETVFCSKNSKSVLQTIKDLLHEKNVMFHSIQHEPTFTSEQSAEARGEDISIGGKSIVMKLDEVYRVFVLSAGKKINSKKIKSKFGCKKIRFATAEELKALTGLVPGSVPPFGKPILPFELSIDDSILKNEMIAFNAGSLTDSIIMKVEDYLKINLFDQFSFSE